MLPQAKSLICVSTNAVVESSAIRNELKTWFGSVVDDWSEIQCYTIPQSLPRQSPGDNAYGHSALNVENEIWGMWGLSFLQFYGKAQCNRGDRLVRPVAAHLAED